jgi:hypothetical protein
VYHGSRNKQDFDEFKKQGRFASGAFMFTPDKEYSFVKGNPNVRSFFLDIKNPREVPFEWAEGVAYQENSVREDKAAGFDGLIYSGDKKQWKSEARHYTQIAVYSPNQIKSATDNAGTFNGDTGKFLFQSSIEGGGGQSDNEGMDETNMVKITEINPAIMVNKNGATIDVKNKSEVEEWLLSQYGKYEPKPQKDGTIKPIFVGNEVEITNDGTIQQFTKTGLVASTKRTRENNHNELYGSLDEIIQNSIFDHDEKADSRHNGLKGQKVYHSLVRLGEKTLIIRIKLDISKYNSVKPAFKDLKIVKEITAQRGRFLQGIANDTKQVDVSTLQALIQLSSSTPEKSSRSADNQKTLSQITDPAERELFQLTEDEIAADAQSYNSWEEWRDASEAGRGDFNIDENGQLVEGAAPDGDLTPEEKDEWYKSQWEAVNVAAPDDGIATSELDRRFVQDITGWKFEEFREQIELSQKPADEPDNANDNGRKRHYDRLAWLGLSSIVYKI